MEFVEPLRSISDIEKVKDLLFKKKSRDFILFEIGINTGLRISDILPLKVKDVKDKDHIVLHEQKTKKFKQVFIMDILRGEINNYVKDLETEQYLFESNKCSNHISRIQAYRILNDACKSVGIKENIGTHTLRKTFGYHFYKKTKDLALLQNILNHSSPKVTMRYIGLNQDIIDDSLKNFHL